MSQFTPTYDQIQLSGANVTTNGSTRIQIGTDSTVMFSDNPIYTTGNQNIAAAKIFNSGIFTGSVGINTSSPITPLDVSGIIRARNYQMDVTGSGIPIITGSLASNTGKITIDFNGSSLYSYTISGVTIISGTNYQPGNAITARIFTSGSGFALTFPSQWTWLTANATGISSGKLLILSLQSWSTADSGVVGAWSMQA